MKLGCPNHIGVAMPSVERLIALYRERPEVKQVGKPFDLPAQSVRERFVDAP